MPFDGYLQIDGVDGESEAKNHEKQIEIEHYSFGIAQSAGHGSREAGHAELDNLTIGKALDSASPILYRACADGTVYAKANLFLTTPGGEQLDYFKIELEHVRIVRISPNGSKHCEGRPDESVELSFKKVTWTYTKIGNDGRAAGDVSSNFDLAKNC